MRKLAVSGWISLAFAITAMTSSAITSRMLLGTLAKLASAEDAQVYQNGVVQPNSEVRESWSIRKSRNAVTLRGTCFEGGCTR
jgi:hypothetical protein